MTATLVRYTVRPEAADENARLVAEVFAELDRVRPPDLRYAVLRLDKERFVHIASSSTQPSPLLSLDSFRRFRDGIAARCVEAPVSEPASLLGAYRFADA